MQSKLLEGVRSTLQSKEKNLGKVIGSEAYKINSAKIYLFKANNINTRKTCEICSKLIIKTPERRRRPSIFIVNFEHVLHLFLVFLLLALNE